MICPSRQEADKAVNACHNKKTLPGVSGTMIPVSGFVLFLLFFVDIYEECGTVRL